MTPSSERCSDTDTSGRRESRRGSGLATAPKSLAPATEINTDAPVGQKLNDYNRCWSCDGTGIDGFDGVECSLCHGKGRLPDDVVQGRSIAEQDAIRAEHREDR